MMTNRSGSGPGDESKDSWATESVPMAVRRQLLERELRAFASRTFASQQQRGMAPQRDNPGDGPTSHPQADEPPGEERPE